MKIKKVDDKPIIIHTKSKPKIHSHEVKSTGIKGHNVYSVKRSPKIMSATTTTVDIQLKLTSDLRGKLTT